MSCHQKVTIHIHLSASLLLLLQFTSLSSFSSIYYDPQHLLVLCVSHSHPCPQPLFMFTWANLFLWLSQPPKYYISLSYRHPFLKDDYTVAVYFYTTRLLCLLFLTTTFIQCKIVYPSFTPHLRPMTFDLLSHNHNHTRLRQILTCIKFCEYCFSHFWFIVRQRHTDTGRQTDRQRLPL